MRIIVLLAALLLMAGPALADEPVDDNFHVNFSGYLWTPSFNGTTGVRGISVPVDASFADILDNSDSLIGIEGRLGVSYGRFGAYVDGLWNKVGIDTVSGPFGFARIDPTLTLTYVEAAVFYHAIDVQPDRSPDRQDYWSFGLGVDVYAGVRYTDVGLQLDFKNINQTESRNKGWVDPIVGARASLDITDNWKLLIDSNFGGFGAASQFTYAGMGLVGYQFTIWELPTTVWAGYKAIYDNYQSGDDNAFKWNMWVHGPIIGATVRFF